MHCTDCSQRDLSPLINNQLPVLILLPSPPSPRAPSPPRKHPSHGNPLLRSAIAVVARRKEQLGVRFCCGLRIPLVTGGLQLHVAEKRAKLRRVASGYSAIANRRYDAAKFKVGPLPKVQPCDSWSSQRRQVSLCFALATCSSSHQVFLPWVAYSSQRAQSSKQITKPPFSISIQPESIQKTLKT